MNSLRGALSNKFLHHRLLLDKKVYSGVRCLFTSEYLGLDVFLNARESKIRTFGSMKDNFLMRMNQQLSNSSSMVFTEDLKSIAYMTEDKSDQLDICLNMIKRFHKQNKELRFGTFVFGPIIMRLIHHLQKPELGLELIRSEELSGFFDQIKTNILLMDLLLEKGYYQEILEVHNLLKANQAIEIKYPKDVSILVAAACYKLNTPESLQYVVDLITECRTAGFPIVRRAIHLVSSLALNQGKPDIAMELLSSFSSSNYITHNNLKLITYAKLGRFTDALALLQNKLDQDQPRQTTVRGAILHDALLQLKESIDKTNDTELVSNYDQLYQSLQQGDFITNQSLDELLTTPIAQRIIQDRTDNFALGDTRERRPTGYPGERNDPFFRRRSSFPVRQRSFEGIGSE